MRVRKVDKEKEVEVLRSFIAGRNKAFQQRSNEHIPYKKEDVAMLYQDDLAVFIAEDGRGMLGGFCVVECQLNGIMARKIAHVWIAGEQQKQGIAFRMLSAYINATSSTECKLMVLDVAHNYKPALKLYKKLGFKSMAVYANQPATFHFVRMIRSIDPYRYSEIKRIISLLVAYTKHYTLYHHDSTPNWVYRNIYARIRSVKCLSDV